MGSINAYYDSRHPLNGKRWKYNACDYTPSDSRSTTRYSPEHGGLVPSHWCIEIEPPDDRYIGRGYINPDAPKKVPKAQSCAHNTHTTGESQ